MTVGLTGSVVITGNILLTPGTSATGSVSGIAVSGSDLLYNNIYFDDSGTVTLTQSGQYITISGSSNSSGVTGYAYVANEDTIAHGLGYVPSYVGLTASGSVPLQFSATSDSTNITVYHTAGGNVGVFWRAI